MPAHKKDESLRRRTNPSTGVVRLYPPKGRVVVPPLPTAIRVWYPQVREWWKRSWSSPMVQMWADVDRDSMFLAARLRHQFWDPETSSSTRNQTAAQIRSIDDSLGLTPLGRRRLGWELGDLSELEESSASRARKSSAKQADVISIDPRQRRRENAVPAAK